MGFLNPWLCAPEVSLIFAVWSIFKIHVPENKSASGLFIGGAKVMTRCMRDRDCRTIGVKLATLGESAVCAIGAEAAFSEGRSMWSITITSTGAFDETRRKPSCSCTAVKK